VKRRFGKRFEDLVTILQYCNEATFYDNENGFIAVAEYKNGEIFQIGNLKPDWLVELMKYMS
jgi:predicted ABC-type ATPase